MPRSRVAIRMSCLLCRFAPALASALALEPDDAHSDSGKGMQAVQYEDLGGDLVLLPPKGYSAVVDALVPAPAAEETCASARSQRLCSTFRSRLPLPCPVMRSRLDGQCLALSRPQRSPTARCSSGIE